MRQLKVLISCFGLMATPSFGDPMSGYNMYGFPGLMEMPIAHVAPDAELAFTSSYVGNTLRNTLAFQISPRLSGSFRYSQVKNFNLIAPGVYGGRAYYDRSFDLRYQVLTEGTYRPAVAVGLRDIIGTGLYSGEYVVASKTFGSVVATGGMGWGRLGSYNSFSNPLGVLSSGFDTRPSGYTGTGGQIETGKWFRGPAALFAGVSWAVNDRLLVKAEYSSDAQTLETVRGHYAHRSPFNFGVDYKLNDRTQLSAYSLYGSEIGVLASFTFNPKHGPNGAGRDPSPTPVLPRAKAVAADLGWSQNPAVTPGFVTALAPILKQDGIILEGMELTDDVVTLRISNTRYGAQAQAIGHTARVVSNALPQSVGTIVVVPMVGGLQGSKVVISRDALEQFENSPDGAAQMLSATQVLDAAGVDRRANLNPDQYPRFTWSLGPYTDVSLFDPNNPVAISAGISAQAEWRPTPGLLISGQVHHRLLDNFKSSPRHSDSIISHVRSDSTFYSRADGVVLDRLTASYLFRPGADLYGRVTAGYLERMYGGVSTEILWKPVGSRFALGAELNYVKQRSFEGLGFKPLTITAGVNHISGVDTIGPARSYGVVTGHVSAYYELANGFHAQLDVGRYLGKDWGATLSVDREFNNGWRVGAYATFTDVSFDDFGEGSFDKGIRVTIPTSWQLGTASRRSRENVIQPLLRDGGARLAVQDRLYDLIRDTHQPQLEARWGRFWR
ncbi:MAG: YjbH domain-containing protein [Planktomarina sp.]